MKDLYNKLKEFDIRYKQYDHPAVYTCEEADKLCAHIEGGKSKNLFLRNEKGNKHYLIILESTKRIDLKKLSQQLEEKSLSFASDKRLIKYLGLTPGSVSPFGLINDTKHEVIVMVDNDLLNYEKLQYHPNINTATLVIAKDDFLKFLNAMKNTVIFADF